MDSAPNVSPTELTEPIGERDHILGPADAPVTLVEYGDYECPSCLNAVPIVHEVRKALGDRLRFVFRHFPQSSIHPNASAAAAAAEAAGDQGKFWEMHEALFKHQKELADLTHLALNVGVEIYKFETARSQEWHRRKISNDHESGRRSGVKKTPTFFINGKKHAGPTDANSLIAAANAAGHA